MRKCIAMILALVMLITCGIPVLAENALQVQEVALDAPIGDEENDTAALEGEIESALEGVEESEAVAADGEIYTDNDVMNILLIGSDERTKDFSDNARGDTCMLFSLNMKTGKIKLVSFERGMGVPILDGAYKGKWDWLTHTFKYGGANLMLREISENFKVDVSSYVRVNLYTFVKLIDAIGGIDIELTSAEARYINQAGRGLARESGVGDEIMHVSSGVNHLNGATAIAYARCRKIDSDWHRIERQRNVIVAALGNFMKLQPSEMAVVALQLMPMVQTNITMDEAVQMVSAATNIVSGETEQMTIPVKGTYGSKKGMGGRSMYSVNFDKNADILKEFLYE